MNRCKCVILSPGERTMDDWTMSLSTDTDTSIAEAMGPASKMNEAIGGRMCPGMNAC